MKRECGLAEESVVVDVGSGTGILARLFLENGNKVFGVEPNHEMRRAGERMLSGFPRFTSVAGTAEASALRDRSADFVTAGQAFHWFDPGPTRAEFARVLKPGGWVVLAWNTRRKTGTPLLEAYERLLKNFGTDYGEVEHGARVGPEDIRSFFRPGTFRAETFKNRQVLDLPGLRGRLLSSSYVPAEGETGYAAMMRGLERAFREHEGGGTVALEYETEVYYGRLARGQDGPFAGP